MGIGWDLGAGGGQVGACCRRIELADEGLKPMSWRRRGRWKPRQMWLGGLGRDEDAAAVASGAWPGAGEHFSVGAGGDPHELSILKAGGAGAVRGEDPRSKISMRTMRPPQQGQAPAVLASASDSPLGSTTGAGGTSNSARALARLAARAVLAKRP